MSRLFLLLAAAMIFCVTTGRGASNASVTTNFALQYCFKFNSSFCLDNTVTPLLVPVGWSTTSVLAPSLLPAAIPAPQFSVTPDPTTTLGKFDANAAAFHFATTATPPASGEAIYSVSYADPAGNLTASGSIRVIWVPAFNVSSLMDTMNKASGYVVTGNWSLSRQGMYLFQAVCHIQYQIPSDQYIGELQELVSTACLLAHNSNVTDPEVSTPRAELESGYKGSVRTYLATEQLLEDKKRMIQNYIDYNQDVKTADVQIYMADTMDVISYYQDQIALDQETVAGYSKAITQVNLQIKEQYKHISAAITEGTEAIESQVNGWNSIIKTDMSLEVARQATAMFFKAAQMASAAGFSSPEGAAGGGSEGMEDGLSAGDIKEMKEWKEYYDDAKEMIESASVTQPVPQGAHDAAIHLTLL